MSLLPDSAARDRLDQAIINGQPIDIAVLLRKDLQAHSVEPEEPWNLTDNLYAMTWDMPRDRVWGIAFDPGGPSASVLEHDRDGITRTFPLQTATAEDRIFRIYYDRLREHVVAVIGNKDLPDTTRFYDINLASEVVTELRPTNDGGMADCAFDQDTSRLYFSNGIGIWVWHFLDPPGSGLPPETSWANLLNNVVNIQVTKDFIVTLENGGAISIFLKHLQNPTTLLRRFGTGELFGPRDLIQFAKSIYADDDNLAIYWRLTSLDSFMAVIRWTDLDFAAAVQTVSTRIVTKDTFPDLPGEGTYPVTMWLSDNAIHWTNLGDQIISNNGYGWWRFDTEVGSAEEVIDGPGEISARHGLVFVPSCTRWAAAITHTPAQGPLVRDRYQWEDVSSWVSNPGRVLYNVEQLPNIGSFRLANGSLEFRNDDQYWTPGNDSGWWALNSQLPEHTWIKYRHTAQLEDGTTSPPLDFAVFKIMDTDQTDSSPIIMFGMISAQQELYSGGVFGVGKVTASELTPDTPGGTVYSTGLTDIVQGGTAVFARRDGIWHMVNLYADLDNVQLGTFRDAGIVYGDGTINFYQPVPDDLIVVLLRRAWDYVTPTFAAKRVLDSREAWDYDIENLKLTLLEGQNLGEGLTLIPTDLTPAATVIAASPGSLWMVQNIPQPSAGSSNRAHLVRLNLVTLAYTDYGEFLGAGVDHTVVGMTAEAFASTGVLYGVLEVVGGTFRVWSFNPGTLILVINTSTLPDYSIYYADGTPATSFIFHGPVYASVANQKVYFRTKFEQPAAVNRVGIHSLDFGFLAGDTPTQIARTGAVQGAFADTRGAWTVVRDNPSGAAEGFSFLGYEKGGATDTIIHYYVASPFPATTDTSQLIEISNWPGIFGVSEIAAYDAEKYFLSMTFSSGAAELRYRTPTNPNSEDAGNLLLSGANRDEGATALTCQGGYLWVVTGTGLPPYGPSGDGLLQRAELQENMDTTSLVSILLPTGELGAASFMAEESGDLYFVSWPNGLLLSWGDNFFPFYPRFDPNGDAAWDVLQKIAGDAMAELIQGGDGRLKMRAKILQVGAGDIDYTHVTPGNKHTIMRQCDKAQSAAEQYTSVKVSYTDLDGGSRFEVFPDVGTPDWQAQLRAPRELAIQLGYVTSPVFARATAITYWRRYSQLLPKLKMTTQLRPWWEGGDYHRITSPNLALDGTPVKLERLEFDLGERLTQTEYRVLSEAEVGSGGLFTLDVSWLDGPDVLE